MKRFCRACQSRTEHKIEPEVLKRPRRLKVRDTRNDTVSFVVIREVFVTRCTECGNIQGKK